MWVEYSKLMCQDVLKISAISINPLTFPLTDMNITMDPQMKIMSKNLDNYSVSCLAPRMYIHLEITPHQSINNTSVNKMNISNVVMNFTLDCNNHASCNIQSYYNCPTLLAEVMIDRTCVQLQHHSSILVYCQ